MKSRMRLRYLIVLLLSALTVVKAQPGVEDLRKISKKYSTSRLAFDITYKLYENYTAKTPSETQDMEISRWDLMVNIKSRHFHVIKNQQQYVYVNFDQKVLMLNPVFSYKKDMKDFKAIEQLVNIDTLLSRYKKIELVQSLEQQRTYRLFMPEGSRYRYTDITINPRAETISRVVMYYAKDFDELIGGNNNENGNQLPRIEVLFNQVASLDVLNEKTFAVSDYVKKTGSEYEANGAYRNYKFINNTHYKSK